MKWYEKIYSVFVGLIFIGCLFSTDSFGARYLVEKPDGSVAIVEYVEGSNDTLEDVIQTLNFNGYPISLIKDGDTLPPRTDRKYWKKDVFGKVVVDTAKKTADQAAQSTKEARKQALLKMTPTEYQEAKDLGLVK